MDHIRKDLNYAFRQVRRSPGTTVIAVIALALGIGLTTTVFSIVYGILLRGMPFDEPQQIVHIDRTHLARDVQQMKATIHDYADWRAQQTSFSDIAAYYYGTVNLSGTDKPERYSGAFVAPHTFELLRAQPLHGRVFRAGDELPGAEKTIVLGFGVFRDRFASDESIIGRSIRANGEQVTVIGVMPDGFAFPYVQQMWLPLRLNPNSLERGAGQEVEVFGRLKSDVSLDQANVELNEIASRLAAAHPATNEGVGVVVQSFIKSVAGGGETLLYTMLIAVFLVLLVACANVANLLLGRAASRTREIGIRTAIGASRGRVISQFLSEALVLAAIGALLGTAVAFLGTSLFRWGLSSFDGVPFFIDIQVDGVSLAFVLLTTIVATLAAGVLPAVQASRTDAGAVLKDARATAGLRIGRTSRAIVVLEIALSCALLVASGLLIRSVTNLRTADYDFATDDVFTARVGLPEAKYADAASQLRFHEELHTKLSALPGVQSASLGTGIPVAVNITPLNTAPVEIDGLLYTRDSDYQITGSTIVTPGYFTTLGVAVQQGRDLAITDRAGSQPVALVNASFAQRYFGVTSPIGRRIRTGGAASTEPWRTIVGVVPDMKISGADNTQPDGIYLPMAQSPQRFASIVLRTTGDPLAMTAVVRGVVASLDTDLPIYHVNSLAGAIHDETWFYRLFGAVFTVLGGVALALSAVGLYGVMAFSVKRRTREMGIRIALGAQVRDVLQLVIGQGFKQIAIGLLLGITLAMFVSQGLVAALYEVDPQDPLVFGGVIATLVASGLAACLVPATRAARVDPLVAIRTE